MNSATARLVEDAKHEIDHLNGWDVPAPFWMETMCCCMRTDCPECGEEARFYADEAHRRNMKREAAYSTPEPAIVITGRMINVEWDGEYGRHWQMMDAGALDNEIWHAHRRGDELSDICDC